MKSQNAKNKLAFNKANVAELNAKELTDVNGGSVVASIVAATALIIGYFITSED